MEEITNIISSVGFPIFVACWMLYKTSEDSAQMKESINALKECISLLTNEIHHMNGDNNNE